MQEATDRPQRLRFGVFEADLRTCELTKQGSRRRLQGQPFQLLALLLEKPGQLVTREELRAKLWPDTVVDFDHGVNKAISKIRETLGDSAESPRFIETVARRGYRFLADVEVIESTFGRRPETLPVGPPPTRDPGLGGFIDAVATSKRLFRPRVLAAVGICSALVLAVSLVWTLSSRNQAALPIHSLAVLPLENVSGDASQDYFADGMTDELIADLGQISALRVISRNSTMAYKQSRKPLPEIARELNVDNVVEGTVLRSGDRVRITPKLIQVPDGRQIWTESYEGDLQDALTLQTRVARDIAQQIRITLNRPEQAALANAKVVNPGGYDAYLEGRYFWNKRTAEGLKTAIVDFNHAIAIDPTYAEAYAGLADAYALSGDWEYGLLSPAVAFPEAKAAATRALALDDKLAEAHTSLAFISDLYDWNWDSAEKEYKLAIALAPDYATAHQWYAWHLMETGQQAEGIAELRKAQGLDPLSPIIGADLADALCVAHLFDEAVEQSRKTLEMHPNFAVAHYELGQALEQKHMYEEAIAELRKAISLSSDDTTFASNLAYALAVSGRREEAIKIVQSLEGQSIQSSSTDSDIALIYVGLGDNDEAMIWLNNAYGARFNPSILMRPAFDNLRSDARFKALVGRIGLPQLAQPVGKAAL